MVHRASLHPGDPDNGHEYRPIPPARSPENTSLAPAILEALFLVGVIVALCLYSADSDEKHVARSDAVQKAESR